MKPLLRIDSNADDPGLEPMDALPDREQHPTVATYRDGLRVMTTIFAAFVLWKSWGLWNDDWRAAMFLALAAGMSFAAWGRTTEQRAGRWSALRFFTVGLLAFVGFLYVISHLVPDLR
jgi:hypothetical protein